MIEPVSAVKDPTLDTATRDTRSNVAAKQNSAVTIVLSFFWIGVILVLGLGTEFDTSVLQSKGEMGSAYLYYHQTATIALIGIGFIYTFLRRFSYGEPNS
jgi:hypothetical protein